MIGHCGKRALGLTLVLMLVLTSGAFGETVYQNNFENDEGASCIYGAEGGKSKGIKLGGGEYRTESVNLESGVYAAEMVVYPKCLPDTAAQVIGLETDTGYIPLVSMGSMGLIFNLSAEKPLYSEFILDWYDLKVVIYDGYAAQVFLNNMAISEAVNFKERVNTAAVVFGSEVCSGEVMLDSIALSREDSGEINRLWFCKNGVSAFSLSTGRFSCGATLKNFSGEPQIMQVILALYGRDGSLIDTSVSKPSAVQTGRWGTAIAEIDVTADGERLAAYIWDGNDSLRPLAEMDENAVITR